MILSNILKEVTRSVTEKIIKNFRDKKNCHKSLKRTRDGNRKPIVGKELVPTVSIPENRLGFCKQFHLHIGVNDIARTLCKHAKKKSIST